MRKFLLLLTSIFVMISTLGAVELPTGTIYYDNTITQFSTVKFVYGYENVREGCTVVTMTKGDGDIWSYTFNTEITDVYKYFFSNTSLSNGKYGQMFSEFKDYITLERGEKRSATTDKIVTSGYIFVSESNNNGNWFQGEWVSMKEFEKDNDTSNLPIANCNPNSGTLPVVYLNTKDAAEIVSKDEYLEGTIYIDAKGIPGYSDAGSSAAPLVTEVKGRGNYTWTSFDKKPYRIKMDKKASLLNMTKDKSYTLLAHADDKIGFLKNTVGFALSRYFGLSYTPGQEPVELMLNGEYRGLYFLTDHIKVSDNRVNITEQDDLETDPAAITGGWLLEIDNYDEDPHFTIYKKDEYGDAMWFRYKSPEELSYQQEMYMTNFLNLANDAVYAEDKSSTEWEKYIDMDALVNYYLVYEIVANREGFHGSCHMHKDRGENTKLVFGPVWDFGSALMNMDNTFIYEDYAWGIKWIDQIAQFPRFQEAVRERWKETRGGLMPYLRKEVDAFIDKITMASQCDCKKWPSYGNKNVLSNKEDFYDMITKRLEWLDTHFGTVGVEEQPSFTINIYPNPTTDKIFIDIDEEILSATIYSLSGEKLLDLDTDVREWNLNLNSGTYLIIIQTEKSSLTNKIIVK